MHLTIYTGHLTIIFTNFTKFVNVFQINKTNFGEKQSLHKQIYK